MVKYGNVGFISFSRKLHITYLSTEVEELQKVARLVQFAPVPSLF